MEKKHKILLLSVSVGAGHIRAAEAIKAYAQQNENLETLHLDVMDDTPKTFRKIYVDTYLKLIKIFPSLWGHLYEKSNDAAPNNLLQKMRRIVERLNTKALLKAIKNFAPDAIICTHFLPAEILMHQINKDNFHTPVWVQVTDFDLHKIWVVPHMKGYFVGNTEIAFRLQQYQLPQDQIHITGLPVMPVFAQKYDRTECLNHYGLSQKQPVVLLMGGGVGLGNLVDTTKLLLKQSDAFQLIVLAGKNEKALTKLNQLAENYQGRLFPQGYTNCIEQFMVCADIAITKPGGLTSAECLAMGLPMILHAPIQGQEERNAVYLLEQGVALEAMDDIALAYKVKHLLSSKEQLAQMSLNAKTLGQPLAAQSALDIVTQYLACS